MKKTLTLILSLLLMSCNIHAYDDTKWVEIGDGTFEYGFIFPYKIKLSIPVGYRNIPDIKQGLVPMKFDLNWLVFEYSKKDVRKLFKGQLAANYSTNEGFELSKNIIEYFLRKLPPVKKHDKWTFTYFPDSGSKLFILDKKIHNLIGAELNRALVQSWLNQSPVLTSQLLNRLLKLQ